MYDFCRKYPYCFWQKYNKSLQPTRLQGLVVFSRRDRALEDFLLLLFNRSVSCHAGVFSGAFHQFALGIIHFKSSFEAVSVSGNNGSFLRERQALSASVCPSSQVFPFARLVVLEIPCGGNRVSGLDYNVIRTIGSSQFNY